MIINKRVLEDKIKEGDSAMCEYLIDNAENDKQVATIQALQRLSRAVPNDDSRYLSIRNKVLFSVGIDVRELQI